MAPIKKAFTTILSEAQRWHGSLNKSFELGSSTLLTTKARLIL